MDTRKAECLANNSPKGSFAAEDAFCGLIFDGVLCWAAAAAGETAVQPCPHLDIGYGLNSLQNATKICDENGTWYSYPEYNTPSNYSLCNLLLYDDETALIEMNVIIANVHLYETWFPIMKTISHIGYWVSLIALILSVFVILFIKKLHCGRNFLHVHLFLSFIMRAIMYLIKNSNSEAVGDIVVDGENKYITENSNWNCKALTSFQFYFIQANFIFILMEGIYLHNLIFLDLFSEKSSIRLYYLFGWGIPIVFISIWVKLRAQLDDILCWTTAKNSYLAFLVQVPIEISVVVNFILFIKITRILFSKINSMYIQRKLKYRRLIRSTLTLLLIYGVPYTISAIVSFCKDPIIEIYWIFCDQTFTAFQGLLMALIYCLLNGEVQHEIKYRYSNLSLRREQPRRIGTVSNTQQISLPLQEDPFLENGKNSLN